MKSVLISIQPQWCEKIASRIKTIEVRKSAPKEVPFKCYIYCTKAKNKWNLSDYEGAYENSKGEIVYAQQHIIGEFICDKVYLIKNQGSRFSVAGEEQSVTNEIARQSCLDYDDMVSYLGKKDGYGLHISDLKIYDKPKELSEFYEQQKANFDVEICSECEREQAKAIHERDKEIERLKAKCQRKQNFIEDMQIKKCGMKCPIAHTLVKEFAEKLKEKFDGYDATSYNGYEEGFHNLQEEIDELLKEYEE